ncbi:GT-D fold domain-containing glycosyltransferase [Flavobacterium sp. FZUC8N2.13]|uniref:GT-D fold domain-containing glycosyltransferase n=1 Tax=Flavobacterium zubiriense TaxID=3138075 RepID=A0ABV4T732_9FLAO
MKKNILKLYYIVLDVLEFLIKVYNFIMSFFRKQLNVKNADETIDMLLSGNFSLSRFGDGEIGMLNGGSIIFQENSKELTLKLQQVLNDNDLPNHITGLPYVYVNNSIFREDAKRYVRKFLLKKSHIIYKCINRSKIYYDSCVTRLYADIEDRSKARSQFEKIKQIWVNKSILIIEGEKSRLGIGSDFFSKTSSIRRIIAPSFNAFNKYEEILDIAKKSWNQDEIVIIALGPTATILAYDLAKLGIRALDFGHIDVEYEWCISNATYKQPLKYKYFGDDSFEPTAELLDDEYEKSIICKII